MSGNVLVKNKLESKLLKNFIKDKVVDIIPIVGFIGVIIFFAIATKGLSLSAFNIKILLNQVVVIAIIATGASFIFSMGAIDISLGIVTCLTCIMGTKIANATGSPWMMLIVCISIGVVVTSINGILIAMFKLPAFIVTLATMNIITAIVSLILGTQNNISLQHDFRSLDTTSVKIVALLIMCTICVIIFNYTKLGRENKIIGGNAIVAEQSGISIAKNTIMSFAITGIGVGIGAFLLLLRTSSVSSQTGSSLGFDVIIAIVLGGMPISGGARSKILAAVIGAFTITALNNGLVIMGVSTGVLQSIRGLIFIIVVGTMAVKTKGKLLVR